MQKSGFLTTRLKWNVAGKGHETHQDKPLSTMNHSAYSHKTSFSSRNLNYMYSVALLNIFICLSRVMITSACFHIFRHQRPQSIPTQYHSCRHGNLLPRKGREKMKERRRLGRPRMSTISVPQRLSTSCRSSL